MTTIPDPLLPLVDRFTSLVGWLVERVAGLGDPKAGGQAGGQARDDTSANQFGLDRTAPPHPVLGPSRAGVLLTRLRDVLARFRAIAATPIPPAKPPAKPLGPKFVPTSVLYTVVLVDELPEPPPRLPSSWRWLTGLLPEAVADRVQLEDLLREPETRALLDADRRLGGIMRSYGWMLGVERKLLPPSRRPKRLTILVPGGRTEAAQAAAEYTEARAKAAPETDVLAQCCMDVPPGRDRRPVWRGFPGRTIRDLAKIRG